MKKYSLKTGMLLGQWGKQEDKKKKTTTEVMKRDKEPVVIVR